MHRRTLGWLGTVATPFVVFSSVVSTAAAQEDGAASNPPAEIAADPYLRVTEERGKRISLEIASRDYLPVDEKGPRVTLVGVAHIGERGFYRALQKQLSEYDVVLYESVLPAGAKGAGGETDKERIQSTRAAMGFVGGVIETHHEARATYPADTESMIGFATIADARLGQWLRRALVDAWGNELVYQVGDDDLSYSLMSLGADGAPGGEKAAADLDLMDQEPPAPFDFSGEDDNIQAQLADVLRLQFQLHAMDYDHDNWRCSDMAMDQVGRAMAERGLDFEVVSGSLAGTSMFAKLAKVFLGVIRFADVFLEGAIADTVKVVLIEMLGDESLIEVSMNQFGEGFGEVIVDMRNQVVIDDLKTLIETEPDVKSVAIFYGAAHMGDMDERLRDQLGYRPDQERWYNAIEIDLEKSVVSERDLRQMRMMMKQTMRMQMGQ